MSGYIFLCNLDTEEECLQRLLFGTNNVKIYNTHFKGIAVGALLFLYNHEIGTLKGPFRALTPCSREIEPEAWKDSKIRGFPYQVRVAPLGEYSQPLTLDDVKDILEFSKTNIGLVPTSKITDILVSQLLEKFQRKNNDFTPIEIRVSEDQLFSAAYIFKCDKVTGGKCFSENIMGAPIPLFRKVVSRVQAGDMIFLWQIEEHRIYGVWRSKSRGQYDPTAFGSKYPAIVVCERSYQLEAGVGENELRSIVPFDGSMPPYVINHEQGKALVDALLSANGESREKDISRTPDVGKYLTDDGHWVRSYSEIIIDNWLFNHGLVHGYEHRVQVGSHYLRSDFYLPEKKIFIEFWGVIGKPVYDKRRQQKLALYRQADCKLLELFPMDIPVISEVLPAKLAEFGVRSF